MLLLFSSGAPYRCAMNTHASAPVTPASPRLLGDTAQGGSVLAFYSPEGSPRPPRIDRGEGVYLWDADGKRYLDATAGAVVANIGHGNPHVLAAMKEQAARVSFAYPRFFESEHNIALADRVCALAGEGFDRAFFISGGSEANESALKLARQYAVVSGQASRWKVISRNPSHHGSTLGALAVTGDAHTQSIYGPMIKSMPQGVGSDVLPDPRRPHPGEPRHGVRRELARTIEREGPESILAFIIEPIGGPVHRRRGVVVGLLRARDRSATAMGCC